MPNHRARISDQSAWPCLPLLLVLLATPPCLAQQVTPTSNGFTIGSSSGRTSFYRQESKSEVNVLLQQVSANVSTAASSYQDPRYTITDSLEPFNIVNERHSRSAGSSTTSIGGGSFSGFNLSVFSQ